MTYREAQLVARIVNAATPLYGANPDDVEDRIILGVDLKPVAEEANALLGVGIWRVDSGGLLQVHRSRRANSPRRCPRCHGKGIVGG